MIDVANKTPEEKPPPLGGGPLGLGDPDDRRLRKTERDIVIPKMAREEALRRCRNEMQKFLDCAKEAGLLVVLKCREENQNKELCMKSWTDKPEFLQEITEEYLNARSYYRKTGKPLELYKNTTVKPLFR